MAENYDAASLLLSLIYPMTYEDMNEAQAAEFAAAAEEQAKYSASSSAFVKSESVGDVSVTYGDGADTLCCYGQPISPAVVARLVRAGMLRRWI